MTTKTELRKQMLQRRSLLSEQEYLSDSQVICRQILTSAEYQRAESVLCYASCRKEVGTTEIIRQALTDGKIVAIPKITGLRTMVFLKIDSMSDLVPGFCGISEPDKSCLEEITSGFVLVPGTAFDGRLYRMGYGGGYYDTWLEKYITSVTTCGLAYDFQLLPLIPCESHDQPLDMLVTPTTILRKRDERYDD